MIPKFILGNGVSNYFGTSENKYENRKICRFCLVKIVDNYSKGPVLSLRQFLAAQNHLKIMTSAFCFMLISLFVLKIFKFLPWPFGVVGKWLDKKAKVNFKICITDWQTNNHAENEAGRPPLRNTIKAISITFQIVDPEIWSILIFYKRVWDQLLHNILCMIFQENYFSCLLTDQILLSVCLYFLRYWPICVLK